MKKYILALCAMMFSVGVFAQTSYYGPSTIYTDPATTRTNLDTQIYRNEDDLMFTDGVTTVSLNDLVTTSLIGSGAAFVDVATSQSTLTDWFKLDDTGAVKTVSNTVGNDGLITGASTAATLTTTTAKLGSAFDFRAVNEGVDFLPGVTQRPFSVSVWYWHKPAANGKILAFEGTGTRSPHLEIAGGYVFLDGNQMAGDVGGLALSPVTDRAWHHIVYTVDLAGVTYLWVNGILADSNSSFSPTKNIIDGATIGRETGGFDPIEGVIEDLRIFSSELTAEQVDSIYGNGSPSANQTDVITYPVSSLIIDDDKDTAIFSDYLGGDPDSLRVDAGGSNVAIIDSSGVTVTGDVDVSGGNVYGDYFGNSAGNYGVIPESTLPQYSEDSLSFVSGSFGTHFTTSRIYTTKMGEIARSGNAVNIWDPSGSTTMTVVNGPGVDYTSGVVYATHDFRLQNNMTIAGDLAVAGTFEGTVTTATYAASAGDADTLDGVDSTALETVHDHSKLVGSGGSPDPALSADASGNITAVGDFTASGEITATSYVGDGSLLTGIEQGAGIYYLLDSACTVVPAYYQLSTGDVGSEATFVNSITATTQTIEKWITCSLGISQIADSTIHAHISAEKSGGNYDGRIQARIYKREFGTGTETLLGQSNSSALLTASPQNYDLYAQVGDTSFATSDTIVFELVGIQAGAGTTLEITTYVEGGDNKSFVEIPIPGSAYVPFLGASRDVDLGVHDLEATSITATNFFGDLNATYITGVLQDSQVADDITIDNASEAAIAILANNANQLDAQDGSYYLNLLNHTGSVNDAKVQDDITIDNFSYVTSRGNISTISPGDLVSGDDLTVADDASVGGILDVTGDTTMTSATVSGDLAVGGDLIAATIHDVAKTDLVLSLDFEPHSVRGATVYDGSEFSNDGSIFGGETTTAGFNGGQAFDFDGSADTVTVAHDDSLAHGLNDFSIVAWFQYDATPASDQFVYLDSGTVSTNLVQNMIAVTSSNGIFLRGRFAGNIVTATYSGASAGQWYHAVGVFDRDGDMTLYINGEVGASQNISAQSANAVSSFDTKYIGSINGASGFFDGKIDDFRIFRRALSAQEVGNLYRQRAEPAAPYVYRKNGVDSGVTKSATEIVVNEDGADLDFRVETDTATNAIYVDSTNNQIGIFDSTPGAELGIAGQVIMNKYVGDYVLEIYNAGAGAGGTAYKGIRVQCGEDAPSVATDNIVLDAYDGDGDQAGYLAIDNGTFELVDVSDESLKEDVSTATLDAEDILNQARVVNFRYKAQPGQHVGFLANELREIFPYATGVTTNPSGSDVLTYKPMRMIPLLVKGHQRQAVRLATARDIILTQGARIRRLEERVFGGVATNAVLGVVALGIAAAAVGRRKR